jgi:hypothetical protein
MPSRGTVRIPLRSSRRQSIRARARENSGQDAGSKCPLQAAFSRADPIRPSLQVARAEEFGSTVCWGKITHMENRGLDQLRGSNAQASLRNNSSPAGGIPSFKDDHCPLSRPQISLLNRLHGGLHRSQAPVVISQRNVRMLGDCSQLRTFDYAEILGFHGTLQMAAHFHCALIRINVWATTITYLRQRRWSAVVNRTVVA